MPISILAKIRSWYFSTSTGDTILQLLFIIKPPSKPSKGQKQPIPNMNISLFLIVHAHTYFKKLTYLLLAIALPLTSGSKIIHCIEF